VRQRYVRAQEPPPRYEELDDDPDPSDEEPSASTGPVLAREVAAFYSPAASSARSPVEIPPDRDTPQPFPEISRAELVKGYEYARDKYVVVTNDDLAKITPGTRREMQILEFVRLAEIDPVYFETSYYVSPERAGEKPYALLLQALRETGFVALAQLAMHNREHVVVIRPGRTGMVLHTMFYESEIRREDEFRADPASVDTRELDLAKRLVEALASPFEPGKYKDTYLEKLNELISSRISGEETHKAPAPKPATVVNIFDALQKSLSMTAERKPPQTATSTKQGKKVRRK
jgi:DNA end-binding protein Ku